MDGKMLNSHGVDFLDGPLGLDIDEKDLDEEETRRDMAKILKELKQKHPDKEVGTTSSIHIFIQKHYNINVNCSNKKRLTRFSLLGVLHAVWITSNSKIHIRGCERLKGNLSSMHERTCRNGFLCFCSLHGLTMRSPKTGFYHMWHPDL